MTSNAEHSVGLYCHLARVLCMERNNPALRNKSTRNKNRIHIPPNQTKRQPKYSTQIRNSPQTHSPRIKHPATPLQSSNTNSPITNTPFGLAPRARPPLVLYGLNSLSTDLSPALAALRRSFRGAIAIDPRRAGGRCLVSGFRGCGCRL